MAALVMTLGLLQPVKGAVVERVQAQAVPGIQPVLLILGPRDDVAGRQQRLDGQAGDAAAEIVGGKYPVAEKALVHAHAHGGFALASGGRQVASVHVRHFLDRFVEPVGQQALAFKRQRFRVLGKFTPDFHFALRAVAHAANASRLQCRIEPGKVGKFQGDGADAAFEHPREFDDARIAHMNGAERNFAIEIEGEDVFLTGPVFIVPGHIIFCPSWRVAGISDLPVPFPRACIPPIVRRMACRRACA